MLVSLAVLGLYALVIHYVLSSKQPVIDALNQSKQSFPTLDKIASLAADLSDIRASIVIAQSSHDREVDDRSGRLDGEKHR